MANRLSTYFSRKMFLTIAFGFSSGLPLALVFGTLSLWLKDYHIAYRTIGAFSLLRLPYSFKWLWAPLVEHTAVPGLKSLGKRRSWALFSQAGLFAGLVCLSGLTPDDGIIFMAMAALFISFFSATQDIVLDAFRVELFRDNQEQEINGATMYVLGYRIGSVVSGAGAIGLAAVLSWNEVYFINALLLLLGMAAALAAKEPAAENVLSVKTDKKQILTNAVIEPLKQFMSKPYWVVALLIVLCYRLGDAYFGPMAYPFYADIGFSKIEIEYISKLYGMAATIIGGVLGGYVLARVGLMRGLLWFAVWQGVTTALYIPLYYVGHNIWFLMFTISLENLSSGMATTAIIAFMSVLCDKGHTATQYALLSSLPGFSRDVLASTSGWFVDQTSWPVFFLFSAFLAVPGMILCRYLYKKRPTYLIQA